MSQKRASLEVIAPSVEEAVAKGLEELDLEEEAVEVEVLDPGSRGLFGIGSRQARVRLTIKEAQEQKTTQAAPTPAAEPQRVEAEPAADASAAEVYSPPKSTVAPREEAPREPTVEGEVRQVAEDDQVLEVARDTVRELLDKMQVRVNDVTSRYGEAEDARSRIPVLVDIHGKDLSILIGPKAETLNAIQFIAALILGKELGRSIPLIVDVEGYRVRREQQIRQLARRMADQALKTGRRQILEPMPANERRLVHIELRENPDVTTQSIGEEPRRKVTIIPEK